MEVEWHALCCLGALEVAAFDGGVRAHLSTPLTDAATGI
jgi:hypothetical protein